MIDRFNLYIANAATGALGKEPRPDGEYILAIDHEKRIAELEVELAYVKAESLRVVKVGKPLPLSELEDRPIATWTNTVTLDCAPWRVMAAERRVDDRGHRYLMPISDEWPPIAYSPDTMVQPVRLERWEPSQ